MATVAIRQICMVGKNERHAENLSSSLEDPRLHLRMERWERNACLVHLVKDIYQVLLDHGPWEDAQLLLLYDGPLSPGRLLMISLGVALICRAVISLARDDRPAPRDRVHHPA